MTAAALDEDVHLFDIEPRTQRVTGGMGNYQLLGDSHLFTPNEPNAVVINYHLKAKAEGAVKITVADPYGTVLAELTGKGEAGLNTATWGMRAQRPGAKPAAARVSAEAAWPGPASTSSPSRPPEEADKGRRSSATARAGRPARRRWSSIDGSPCRRSLSRPGPYRSGRPGRREKGLSHHAGAVHRGQGDGRILGAADRDETDGHHPAIFKKCEETGRIDNFAIAGGLMKGEYKGERYNDTDVYKTIEGASYSLMVHPDPALDRYLDGVIAKIAAAQEPDGYLYTPRTASPDKLQPGIGETRWAELAISHELYNAGHLYEAAAAHFMATGKRALLDVALKNADLVARTFGPEPGKRQGFPGHQEIELALVKLYRLTGKREYLDLAKHFLDQRGRGLTLKQYRPAIASPSTTTRPRSRPTSPSSSRTKRSVMRCA